MGNQRVFEVCDEAAFFDAVNSQATLQKLATGLKFTEGPVWLGGKDGFLVFSDIPASRLYRWKDGETLSVFRDPSRGANGNTADGQGRLVTCEHASRQVTRTAPDGTIEVLATRYQEKRLNSPNDLVVKSDGSIYFTDPPYGLHDKTLREQPKNYVFRLSPKGELAVVADDLDMPNGLCFSPDEKLLYVADSGKPRHIRVFDVREDGALTGGRLFCTIDNGAPDGIRADANGRLYSSAGDGVHIFAKDGKLLGKILVPEAAANLCFGGADGKTLFITARTSLYSIRLK